MIYSRLPSVAFQYSNIPTLISINYLFNKLLLYIQISHAAVPLHKNVYFIALAMFSLTVHTRGIAKYGTLLYFEFAAFLLIFGSCMSNS